MKRSRRLGLDSRACKYVNAASDGGQRGGRFQTLLSSGPSVSKSETDATAGVEPREQNHINLLITTPQWFSLGDDATFLMRRRGIEISQVLLCVEAASAVCQGIFYARCIRALSIGTRFLKMRL